MREELFYWEEIFYMFWYIDPYYFMLIVPAMLIALLAQARVSSTFNRYSRVYSHRGITAAQVARNILDENGLYDVQVQRVAGSLTDHYDPRSNVVRLSDSVYTSTSIAAIGVAAHEVGHAIQHATDYAPLTLRNAIIPVTNLGSRLSIPLIIAGLLFSAQPLVQIGILAFSLMVVFQLVTLPVEFNASNRAIANSGCGRLSGSGRARRCQKRTGSCCHDLCGCPDHSCGSAAPSDPAVRPAGQGLT